MSTTTTNYNLVKPALTDAPPDITAMNPNWDTIDNQLKNLHDSIENKPSVTVDSALSDTSANPVQNKVVKAALDSKLSTTGGTVTGTLVLSKVADADGDAYTSPALVVGGEPTTYHVELDNNEIQAKINKTTPGNLFLNSNGGKVTIGEGGLENRGDFLPVTALTSNMGTATLPWNRINARYFDLFGAADTMYGRFRVATTGTSTTDGVATLSLGNEIASGTANNASGKITMYGSGTGFTNILPNSNTSGSNAVYLPTDTGTLALTKDIDEVKTSVSEGKALVAAAVTDKGVSTAADATFATMATNIRNIPTKKLEVTSALNVSTVYATTSYNSVCCASNSTSQGNSIITVYGDKSSVSGYYYKSGVSYQSFSKYSSAPKVTFDGTTLSITTSGYVFYLTKVVFYTA